MSAGRPVTLWPLTVVVVVISITSPTVFSKTVSKGMNDASVRSCTNGTLNPSGPLDEANDP